MEVMYIRRIHNDTVNFATKCDAIKYIKDRIDTELSNCIEYQKYKDFLLMACKNNDIGSCKDIIDDMQSVVKDICCNIVINIKQNK